MGADIAQLNSKVRTRLFSSTGNQTVASLGGRLCTQPWALQVSRLVSMSAVNGGSLSDNLAMPHWEHWLIASMGKPPAKSKQRFQRRLCLTLNSSLTLCRVVLWDYRENVKMFSWRSRLGKSWLNPLVGGRIPLHSAMQSIKLSVCSKIIGQRGGTHLLRWNTSRRMRLRWLWCNNAFEFFDWPPTPLRKSINRRSPTKPHLEKIVQSVLCLFVSDGCDDLIHGIWMLPFGLAHL